jgi:hypothetical protein
VELLALGQADLQLGPPALPIHGRGDQGVAGAFGEADEAVELGAFEEGLRVRTGSGDTWVDALERAEMWAPRRKASP